MSPRRISLRRIAYAALSMGLVIGLLLEVSKHGGWTWVALVVGVVGPDLALVVGASSAHEQGHLPPAAVRPYNLLHRIWGPLVVLVAAAVSSEVWAPVLYTVALAWLLHVTGDRAAGYRLRARDGSIRPESDTTTPPGRSRGASLLTRWSEVRQDQGIRSPGPSRPAGPWGPA
jgi:hypothetical protein